MLRAIQSVQTVQDRKWIPQELKENTYFSINDLWHCISVSDEKLCFPEKTMIITNRGQKPIETIKKGEWVLTRKGFQKVLATSKRSYSGKMVTIIHEKGIITSTFNHPIWEVTQGWKSADKFIVGDCLQTVNNEISRVLSVFEFTLGNSNNQPAIISKEQISLNIMPFVSMPIITVNFKSNSKNRNQKINAVPAHLSLLNKFNFSIFKNLPYTSLKKTFASIFAVTRNTTKLAQSLRWSNSERFTASFANYGYRWSSAFFTTKPTIYLSQRFFSLKNFTASFTRNMFNLSHPAFHTAKSVSVSYGSVNPKGFSTFRANFLNSFRSKFTAFHRAKLIFSFHHRRGKIKTISALKTNSIFPTTHDISQSINQTLLANNINVYNLQVKGDHTYFANEILVHNCDYCAVNDGEDMTGDVIRGKFPDLEIVSENIIYLHVHVTLGWNSLADDHCRCIAIRIVAPLEILTELMKKAGVIV